MRAFIVSWSPADQFVEISILLWTSGIQMQVGIDISSQEM